MGGELQEKTANAQFARGFGYAITNFIKLAGVAIAINEALIRSELRPMSLAVAAFMMAGAQGVETFLDKLLGAGRPS